MDMCIGCFDGGEEAPSEVSEGVALWREMERARKKARRDRMHAHAN